MKGLIVLFIGVEKTERIVYALNTVFAQTISNISLLIIGNRNANIHLEKMLETISSNRTNNVEQIYIELPRLWWSIEEQKQYVQELIKKEQFDWVSVLSNGSAYYTSDVLQKLRENLDDNTDAVFGNDVLFDQDDTYCGEHKYSVQEIVNLLQTRTGEDEILIPGGIIRIDKREYQYKVNTIKTCEDVFAICKYHKKKKTIQNRNDGNQIVFNYTQTVCMKEILKKNMVGKSKRENALKIDKIVRTIENLNGNIWGESISELAFRKFLKQIQCENYISAIKIYRKTKKNKKIKTVFFCHQYNTWASLKSVYEEMCMDVDFEPCLVYVQGNHINSDETSVEDEMDKYHKNGYSIICWKDYKLVEENPDIAIFVIPYSHVDTGFDISEISKVVRRTIYIPYGYTLETKIQDLVKLRYQIAMQYLAWKVMCDDKFGLELAGKYAWSKGKNFVAWGNPRQDALDGKGSDINQEYISMIKERANGRKIVLWNTHHSVNDTSTSFSSWKKYGELLIDLFQKRRDIFVLWRPHPLFFKAIEKYYPKDEYGVLQERVNKMDNLLIDKSDNYMESFLVSDLFVSDASSLVKEYVHLRRPVLLTTLDKEIVINESLRDCCCIPNNEIELEEYLDDMLLGKNVKEVQQINYTTFGENDKCIGKKVVKEIKNNLNQELKILEY